MMPPSVNCTKGQHRICEQRVSGLTCSCTCHRFLERRGYAPRWKLIVHRARQVVKSMVDR